MNATPASTRDAQLSQLRQLRMAKDAMDRDWAEPIDMEAVAAHAGYSRYHFVRVFRAVYGQTPGQYLSRRRIERAENLLRTADLSVTEICALVGFTSLGLHQPGGLLLELQEAGVSHWGWWTARDGRMMADELPPPSAPAARRGSGRTPARAVGPCCADGTTKE
jgi:AraC-like DNA-binding protein